MSMLITPTQRGTFIAGAGWWALVWSLLFKSQKLPMVGKFVPRERILNWIENNKIMTFMMGEMINLATHTGVLGVTFALGGTCINSLIIFVLFPFRKILRLRKAQPRIIRGAPGIRHTYPGAAA